MVRLAPLNVPLERRLQTSVVSFARSWFVLQPTSVSPTIWNRSAISPCVVKERSFPHSFAYILSWVLSRLFLGALFVFFRFAVVMLWAMQFVCAMLAAVLLFW